MIALTVFFSRQVFVVSALPKSVASDVPKRDKAFDNFVTFAHCVVRGIAGKLPPPIFAEPPPPPPPLGADGQQDVAGGVSVAAHDGVNPSSGGSPEGAVSGKHPRSTCEPVAVPMQHAPVAPVGPQQPGFPVVHPPQNASLSDC